MLWYVSAQTVQVLNLTAYYGRWIQLYSDYAVQASFERNLVCDSAYYYPYPNDTVAVVNSGNYESPLGNLSQVYGWAAQGDPSKPGQLTVHLNTGKGGSDFGAPYWVYKLGPIVNTQYQYSVVSDDLKLTLFVLARNYTSFFNLYAEEVLTWLFRNGFNGVINSPIPTPQDGCVYPYHWTEGTRYSF